MESSGPDARLPHLPVGFERFHPRRFINYQLNRAHALGFAKRIELATAAANVRSAEDCARVFDELSQRVASEGRLGNAASYLRIAEFFTPGQSAAKIPRYHRYRDLFDAGFAHLGAVRHDVPYSGAFLPAYRLAPPAGVATGTVLIHGGFDSLIEEFVAIWQRIAHAGFDVIAFDGPGQGGARRLADLTFDHDWEKPVGAVLDHFGIRQAGLVGISMGGYWALRAAAFEHRIDRVVSWPPVYDWLLRAPQVLRRPARAMLRQRAFMRQSIRVRARLVATLGLVVDQALFNIGSNDPADIVDWFLGMNPDHLGSGRVTQDVLLMVGEHDAFQPPKLAQAQAAALVNARSLAVRTFTRAEQADQHCQMGNLALACAVVTQWLGAPAAGSSRRRA